MVVRARPIVLAVSLGIFLTVICGLQAAQSGRGWMKGVVLGLSDSQGMSGALVELTGDPENPRLRHETFRTITDDHGFYLIEAIPYGDHLFKVSAAGFKPYEIKLYIPSDAETQLHVRLKKEE